MGENIRQKQFVVWVHSGAFGELVAILPLLDALAARYPGMSIRLIPAGDEYLTSNLIIRRSYISVVSPIDTLNAFKLVSLLKIERPLFLVSQSFKAQILLLGLSILFQVPIIYVFEALSNVSMGLFGTLARKWVFGHVLALISQKKKRRILFKLGCPNEQILEVKSLKFLK